MLARLGLAGLLSAALIGAAGAAGADYSGTYDGSWSETAASGGCTLHSDGALTVTIALVGAGSYHATLVLANRPFSRDFVDCTSSDLRTQTLETKASVKNGKLVSSLFTVSGASLTGSAGRSLTLTATRVGGSGGAGGGGGGLKGRH